MSNNPPDGWLAINGHPSSYELSTRILVTVILALILIASIVILLHLYFRYVLCLNGFGRRSSIDVHVSIPTVTSSGLDPLAIAALPTFAHKGESVECTVCLSAVEEGETVRRLTGCSHVFHDGCVDMWLRSHSTCPVCRAAVETPPAATEVAETSESRGKPGKRVEDLEAAVNS